MKKEEEEKKINNVFRSDKMLCIMSGLPTIPGQHDLESHPPFNQINAFGAIH